MKSPTPTKRSILFLSLAAGAALSWATPALAQHDHGKAGQPADHSHGEVAKAKSFGEAARRMADEIKAIGAALSGGSVAGVSDRANTVATIAKDLGALSLAKDSGVAREKVKDANLAGKELAEAANALHEIADKVGAGGDLAASKAQFEKVKSAAAKIDAVAPATYYCPMFCEGSKTYDKPGECPVCHMKLKKQTSEQFSVEVKPVGGGKLEAGKPVSLIWTLKDPRGMQVKDVEIVHEMPLHLLMVSKDLSWYAHEHPKLEADGTFTMKWTFPSGGEYTLFHDFTPKEVGMQVVPVTLKVEGAAPAAKPLVIDSDKPKNVDGYTVTLDTGGPVKTGAATHMAYTISKDGKPVTDLAPYLGAMGHLVIISQDLKEFVHSHPHEGGEHAAGGHDDKGKGAHGHDGDVKGGPKVDFEAHFKAAGVYKGWAQFQHNGKVITVPFTFNVAKGEGGGEAKPHDHGGKDDHGKKDDHDHGK
ncbi:MAG TPA: heavy metal-binding domain-containing protein [Phycisphaerales bacterium]|nr:heavy metal-binding domain-containing protein [Phycisphaerales bacterium]